MERHTVKEREKDKDWDEEKLDKQCKALELLGANPGI